jgi:hypothetical protein
MTKDQKIAYINGLIIGTIIGFTIAVWLLV